MTGEGIAVGDMEVAGGDGTVTGQRTGIEDFNIAGGNGSLAIQIYRFHHFDVAGGNGAMTGQGSHIGQAHFTGAHDADGAGLVWGGELFGRTHGFDLFHS